MYICPTVAVQRSAYSQRLLRRRLRSRLTALLQRCMESTHRQRFPLIVENRHFEKLQMVTVSYSFRVEIFYMSVLHNNNMLCLSIDAVHHRVAVTIWSLRRAEQQLELAYIHSVARQCVRFDRQLVLCKATLSHIQRKQINLRKDVCQTRRQLQLSINSIISAELRKRQRRRRIDRHCVTRLQIRDAQPQISQLQSHSLHNNFAQ